MATPLERLAISRDKLNAMSTEADAILEAAAEELAKVNPRLPVYIVLPSGLQFGWDKLGGRWCFVARRQADLEHVKDAGRIVRIEAADNIDSLLDKIAAATEKWIAAHKGQR